MSYVTETEIAEELRNALSAYGDIKAGTPLYDLTSVLGEVISRLNNDLDMNKLDKHDMDITTFRSDIELLKKSKEDIISEKRTEIATQVAELLWEKLRKEREEDKSGFIEELSKI